MASNKSSTTFSSTYKDDWTESDNYHKILFNNGRALQARELTQMQTIIQEEMARFGKNIFKEGASVSGGVPRIDGQYRFVTVSTTSLAAITQGMVYTNGQQRAKILLVDDTNDKLYLNYIDNGGAGISSFTQFIATDVIDDEAGGGPQLTVTGNGSAVNFSVSEGDFFVDGHFVYSAEQSVILNSSGPSVDTVVGFKVEEKIITINDDPNLYDNAGDVVNTSSPGADRYQINLILTTEDALSAGDIFVFLARIENSTITEVVDANDQYSNISDMLAERTKEESGNYVVKPFTIAFTDIDANDNINVIVSDGVAYVNGYRVEQQSPTKLSIPRPQATETVDGETISVSYGNYFVCSTVNLSGGQNLFGNDAGASNHTKFTLNGSGVTGTCHLRCIEPKSVGGTGAFRAYVYAVNVTSGNIANVTSLTSSSGVTLNIEQNSNSQTTLYEAGNNNAFESFPRVRPQTMSAPDTTIIRSLSTGALGGTTFALPSVADGGYVNTESWIIYNDTDNVLVTNAGFDLTVPEISNLTSGKDYVVVYFVSSTSANNQARSKQLATSTIASSAISYESGGSKYIPLNQYDIYQIDSVRLGNSGGPAADPFFRLDNGQRDNYYAKGKLYLDSDVSYNGTVYVKFQHFTRNINKSNDRFYNVNSYPAGVPYSQIPMHKLSDGTVLPLRNVLDYRPDFDESVDSVVTSTVFPFPKNGTNVIADTAYYLPRADKLLVSQEGDLEVLLGQQSPNPQFKQTPENSLELFKMVFNANTLDENDMQITPIEHKHYTMGDIAKIEEKLERLSDYTEFNFLELETKLTPELDSAGDERAESGILVDDASDQKLADTQSPDYCASLDPDSKLFRPCFDEDNIRLIFDASLNPIANNITRKGDLVMLNFDSAEWISQPLATKVLKINPTGKVDNTGCLMLSPSSDEWKNGKYEAAYALPGANRLDVKQSLLWNNWQWNWSGRSIEDEHEDITDDFVPSNRQYGAFGRKSLREREQYRSEESKRTRAVSTGRSVRRLISTNTLRERVGNRVIDLALIPWIRSRLIFFKAMGLKPNTVHTPYFDGVDVSSFCRSEAFQRFSTSETEYGNIYDNSNTRPSALGASNTLTTDSFGEISGSFWIPSVRPTRALSSYGVVAQETSRGQRFKAGTKEFKLIDASSQDLREADSKATAYYTVKGAVPHNVQSIVSTRFGEFASAFASVGTGRIFSTYNPSEIQAQLNLVNSGEVLLTEPHLSGQWGSATTPVNPASVLNRSEIISDYVNVNQLIYGGTSNLPTSMPMKPLAQQFYVDNPFGVTLVDVDLYFSAIDTNNLPVQIQIRPIVNGAPSLNRVVPGSCVFKKPGDIVTSTAADVATKFIFDEPVVLDAWTNYAIVVISQSIEYDLWAAQSRQYVFGAYSTSQPYTTRGTSGNLYLPQSGPFYIPSRDQDLKFTLNRAKFAPKDNVGTSNTTGIGGSNGSLILRNASLPQKLLELNPFITTNGSSRVYVKHPCHGFNPGDTCTISGASGTVGGLTVNGTFTVDVVDTQGFAFKPGGTASSDNVGGGDAVLADRYIHFESVMPYLETLVPSYTSADFSGRFTTGATIGQNSSQKYQSLTTDVSKYYSRITPGSNVFFEDKPRIIVNNAKEIALGAKSTLIKVDLKSGNDFVSPIVDLQRASLFLIGNCIEDSDERAFYPVPEISPNSGRNGSRHLTTPITLAQDAVGFSLRHLYSTPSDTDFDFYYRTAQSGQNIYDQQFVKLDPIDNLVKGGSYEEAQYLGGDVRGNLDRFSQIQAKFVMHSSNSTKTPKLTGFKWKFLAT